MPRLRTHCASVSVTPRPSFVPLPYLQTENLTESDSLARPTPTIRPAPTAQPSTSRLSTAAIVALAVSGGLTLVIVAVLAKIIKRPRRRRTPTPSLPILHDGAFPDDSDSQGSPIFGGKDRSSPHDGTGPWTWTQYNSGIPKPAPIVTVTRSNSPTIDQTDNDATLVPGQTQAQYPFVGYGNSNVPAKTTGTLPLQPVQNAITRAVSRLSTVSMSLYPTSPGGDVGVAIDGITQGEQANATVPKYKDRIRNRSSMIAPGNAKDPAALRRSQSFAYGGMEPLSPNKAQSNGGRARIKSTYYTPGSYPRTSAAATSYGKLGPDQDHDERCRRDSRCGRDLSLAVSLTSPVPPSPQPTLYPDDSMSVIGEAKKVTLTGRSQKKPVPKANCDSPSCDTAALGSLMMVDFAASKSAASSRPCEGQTAAGKSSLKKRVEDKPPRVPSPPPIPSLAQMALQHADPEGYADYHSPTYSIYGLYDGDRKSRGLSYGY